jgi:putative copper export protein
MLTIDIDVIRVTLHVLAATIWVGGQIVLVALMTHLHRAGPAGNGSRSPDVRLGEPGRRSSCSS